MYKQWPQTMYGTGLHSTKAYGITVTLGQRSRPQLSLTLEWQARPNRVVNFIDVGGGTAMPPPPIEQFVGGWSV